MGFGEISIIVAIVLAAGSLIWQLRVQASKLDTRIETEVNRLETQIKSLDDKVSDAALAAARNEGRYEVLVAQTHTHESNAPAAADPAAP